MATKEYHYCDLCGLAITPYNADGYRLIDFNGGHNQVVVVGHIIVDICSKCCEVLFKAKAVGVIQYDEESLYKQAGFKKRGDIWIKE